MDSADEHYLRAIQRIYNLNIKPDWWKIPALASASWGALETIILDRDKYCNGVVLLGLNAPAEELMTGFNATSGHDIVKGFAVGRTIFGQPSREWLAGHINDETFINNVKANYHHIITMWRDRA